MNYLFAGKSGVFETLIAAYTYLGKENEALDLPLFGDIKKDLENTPIFIALDDKGNSIYTIGAKNYDLLPLICAELDRVAGREHPSIKVIPVEVKGDSLTAFLCDLSRIPLIGSLFSSLAKIWVITRKKNIINRVRLVC